LCGILGRRLTATVMRGVRPYVTTVLNEIVAAERKECLKKHLVLHILDVRRLT
jgi:hypothetical protein